MKQFILIFIFLSFLTACGGKEEFGNAVIDNYPGLTSEERAVLKIANYVKNNEGQVPPLSLFTDAGFVDVNDINKDSILMLLAQSDFDTVNSKSEVQAIIEKYNKAINKIKLYARDNTNVSIPTVEDYVDIGIKDIAPKIDALHIKLKELPVTELEKLSLIKILKILDTI